jgi:hypothetical protein
MRHSAHRGPGSRLLAVKGHVTGRLKVAVRDAGYENEAAGAAVGQSPASGRDGAPALMVDGSTASHGPPLHAPKRPLALPRRRPAILDAFAAG